LRDERGFNARERREERAQPVRRHPFGVEAYALDVVVTREDPGFQRNAPMRGILIPKPRVEREWVGHYGGIVRPVLERHGRRIAGST